MSSAIFPITEVCNSYKQENSRIQPQTSLKSQEINSDTLLPSDHIPVKFRQWPH